MFVKGKDSFNTGLIYQGKAGAVRIAQPFIVNLSENSLCGIFNIFSNTKDSNVALVHLIHELYGCGMAAPHFEKCIGFIQDIIRGADKNFILVNLFIDRFCFVIMLVFGNGESAEGACIHKDFQCAAFQYRYLSW